MNVKPEKEDGEVGMACAPTLRAALLGACVCLLFLTGCSGDDATEPRVDEPGVCGSPGPPNVLLITADDLGWKDLRCYGNPYVQTPNIDRLADEGIRFTNAFVVVSSCSPSRTSLKTGQYPHTNGAVGLTNACPRWSLPAHYQPLLPTALRRAGYRTAVQGKWHVAPFRLTSKYGYDERLSGILPDQMHIEEVSGAVEFIRRNHAGPWYLEINFMNNHRLDNGEFEFAEGFPVDPDEIGIPAYWTLPDWPDIRLDVAKYFSQTEKMDSLVGEVLATLDDLGLTENTIVVFLSDNGPPYPGNKMTLYDRGVGTPLIVRWPACFGRGLVAEGLVESIDIMPTLLEAAGIPVPPAVQGRSFFDYLLGGAAGPFRTSAFAEMNNHLAYLPTRSVRTTEWKYIRNFSDSSYGLDQCCPFAWAHRLVELPGQPWKEPRLEEELYRLTEDPNEQANLAYDPDYADILEDMRTLLRDRMAAAADPFLDSPFERVYLDTHCGTRNDGPGPTSPIPLKGCFWIWGEPICPPMSCQ